MLIQIGDRWISTNHITSIRRYDHLGEPTVSIHIEHEADGFIRLRDPAEVDAFLTWLSKEALVHVVI